MPDKPQPSPSDRRAALRRSANGQVQLRPQGSATALVSGEMVDISGNGFGGAQQLDPLLRVESAEIREGNRAERQSSRLVGRGRFTGDPRLCAGDSGRPLSACLEQLGEPHIQVRQRPGFSVSSACADIDHGIAAQPNAGAGEPSSRLLDPRSRDQHGGRLFARAGKRFFE